MAVSNCQSQKCLKCFFTLTVEKKFTLYSSVILLEVLSNCNPNQTVAQNYTLIVVQPLIAELAELQQT